MNPVKTIAFAGALGIVVFACGHAAPALAQAAVDYRTGELVPAVMPAGQRGNFVAEAYGDVLGRDAGKGGDKTQDFHFVPAVQKGITDGTITDGTITDGTRAGFVNQAYGDVLNRDTDGGRNGLIGLLNQQNPGELVPAVKPGELVPAVMPTDQNGGSLNSLGSVGSIGDLFALSRGDNGMPRGGNVQGAGPHVNPGAVKGLNFTNQGGATAGGGPHVNPGAAKGLNFTNTAHGAGGGGGTGNPATIKALNFTRTGR